MPIYTFKNRKTGRTKEYTIKLADYDQFKADHPELERVIDNTVYAHGITAGAYSATDLAVKKDKGWGEVLAKIGEQNPHSPLAQEHHRNKSIKRIKAEQVVEKHAKKQAEARKRR